MARSVLIVEDEVLIAFHLQDLVEDAGCRVTALARDASEAIAAAAAERPDMALMDIRLANHCNGIDVARTLFEQHRVRCVFLSANLDPQTRRQAEALQPLGFIGKPFLATDVSEALRSALSQLDGR